MARELKIFGCMLDGAIRAVVAAASLTEAASLFGVSLNYLNGYGGETWNAAEVNIALAHPRQVYAASIDWNSASEFMPLSAFRDKLRADAKDHYEGVLKNSGKR